MASSMINVFPVRSWVCGLAVLSVMGLVGCSRSLDVKTTEKTLKEELAKQGVGSLKQVSCPQDMKAGQKFSCIGIFESGIGFNIPVEQKGENDKLMWEIPTIKGMLNMNQVLKTIQSELKLGEGAIDCGTSATYRMATLGSTFECVITASLPDGKAAQGNPDEVKAPKPEAKSDQLPSVKDAVKPIKEPDKIEIAIAASGDVTWQRMIAGDPKKSAPITGAIDPKGGDKSDKASETLKTDTKTDTPAGKQGQPQADSKAKSGAGKAPKADEEEVPYDS
jgi:hypothetical protein